MNDNCLAGIKCPTCASSEPFIIAVSTTTLMYDDGSDPTEKHGTDLEWSNDSYIQCTECGEEGSVGKFTIPDSLPESEPCETNLEPADKEVKDD